MANIRKTKTFPVCLIVVAALVLISVAEAAPPHLQQMFTAQMSGPAPPEVLPPVHSPRPYREAAKKPCDETDCFVKFDKVADFRLLEISNVSCINLQQEDNPSNFFVLTKSTNLNKPNAIVAVLPSLATGAGGIITTNLSGPYYFNAGERPFVYSQANPVGVAMICTISGTLWRTD
jgi:hypothetical protein